MKRLHEILIEKVPLYAWWHGLSLHGVAHWLALIVIVVAIGALLDATIQRFALEAEPESQVAAAFSAGRVVGVAEGRILVSFKDSVGEKGRAELMKKYGLKERGYIPALGVHQFEIPAGDSAETFVKKMRMEPESFDFAEPDYLVEPSVVPNDPWYQNWQKDKEQIHAPSAWDSTTGKSSVIVAVADTGVNCAHEDLVQNCVEGANVVGGTSSDDVAGHGTAVAGVLGAAGNNGIGVAGGAWQVSLMPIVVSGVSGAASYSAIASAVTYAADHGARVVNNSYQSGGSLTVQKAARYLAQKGGVLVVAEGNYATDSGTSANQYVVSVGAVDSTDTLYSWSSFGADVDVVAPGCTGATTARGGGYGSFCGTSNAAPEVAAVLALVFSINSSLTSADAVWILTSSSKDLGPAGWDSRYGWGRVDAAAAVEKAKNFVPSGPIIKESKKKP
jgi:subtilisin family serine protease